jgi:hypothetical protein
MKPAYKHNGLILEGNSRRMGNLPHKSIEHSAPGKRPIETTTNQKPTSTEFLQYVAYIPAVVLSNFFSSSQSYIT